MPSAAPISKQSRPKQSGSPSRWLVRLAWILGVALVALVLLGFALGPIVKSVVNRRLAEMPEYTGHVGKVAVSLWRGHMGIGDAVFSERARAASVPLAKIREAHLNISYLTLLRGKLSASAKVEGAEINIAAKPGPAKEKDAAGKEKGAPPADELKAEAAHWQEQLQRSFPIELSRLEVSDAKVHFVDESKSPKVDVGLDRLHIVATGLANRPKGEAGALPARVEVNAITTGDGKLELIINADPLADQPTFNTQLQLRALALPAFNSFLLAYANADVSAGTFEFDSEINAADGHYEGYVKPFFKDLNFKTASDKDKNAIQLLTKKAISAVATVLKNDEKKVATKAPFSGNFEKNQVGIWETIVNLLRNAFVQGLREGLEGQTPAR